MKTKKIFSLFLARNLCKMEYVIVNIELNKKYNKQIYVFKVEEGFYEDLNKLSEDFKTNNK